jgi:hypothetical protein
MEEATNLRDAIERGSVVSSNLIGIGLSLSYHLVLALGATLVPIRGNKFSVLSP